MAGCSALVPSGVARLSAISPLEADPDAIAVALVLPEGVDLVPGSARLAIEAVREDTGEAASGDFALSAAAADATAFGAEAGQVRVLSVAEDAGAPMRALQATVRDWKAAGAGTHGQIAVRMAACHIGAGPAPDARASVYLRTDPSGEFFAVLRDGPLSEIAGVMTPAGDAACPGEVSRGREPSPHARH
ncbi:MAG: hypothetical protein KDE00_15240 [Rhodobacteraceae bacterium]|nr:hypothetical protein [Paracoccaceae bacterium]